MSLIPDHDEMLVYSWWPFTMLSGYINVNLREILFIIPVNSPVLLSQMIQQNIFNRYYFCTWKYHHCSGNVIIVYKHANTSIILIMSSNYIYVLLIFILVDPLSPHDALKHHFASLMNDLISRT